MFHLRILTLGFLAFIFLVLSWVNVLVSTILFALVPIIMGTAAVFMQKLRKLLGPKRRR